MIIVFSDCLSQAERMSFFIRKGGGLPLGKKRKAGPEKKIVKKARKAKEDEEVDSDGSDIEVRDDAGY